MVCGFNWFFRVMYFECCILEFVEIYLFIVVEWEFNFDLILVKIFIGNGFCNSGDSIVVFVMSECWNSGCIFLNEVYSIV